MTTHQANERGEKERESNDSDVSHGVRRVKSICCWITAAAGTLGIRGEKPEDINIQQEKAEASLVMAVVGATE